MGRVLMVIFLVACSMNDQGKNTTAGTEAGHWRLTEIDGNAAAHAGWLEIDLAGSRITGNAGCNDFQVGFEGTPQSFTAGPVGGTKKLCPEPIMAQERRVYEILRAATSASVDGDGSLRLSGTRGYLRGAR